MNNNLIEKLKTHFATPDGIKKVETLLRLSSETMELMQKRTSIKDPKEAFDVTTALMKAAEELQKEYQAICDELGISKEEMAQMMANAQNFSPAQWSLLQGMKSEVAQKVQHVTGQGEKKPKGFPTHKNWLSA